jgi:hypothetical protein
MRWGTQLYSPNSNRLMPISAWYEMRRFSLSQGTNMIEQSGIASAGWPAANRAIYMPFMLEEPMYVIEAMVHNGSGPSTGSYDVGIYSVEGVRLVSSGLVAQSGADPQTIALTDTWLDRGVFYMALMATSTSTTVFRFSGGDAQDWLLWGAFQEATGGTLPAVATFASNTTAYCPGLYLFSRTS